MNRPPDELRAELLGGYATINELAAALGCSPRTVHRMGLPYVKVRNRRLYHIEKTRSRLLEAEADTRAPASRPGRPRKAA